MLSLKKNHSVIEGAFNKSSLTFILNTTIWVTMVDGVVIGNFLGIDAVASYGLAWPIVLFYGVIAAVFSGGTRTLYSQLVGKGRIDEANKVFSVTCVASTFISVLLVALSLVFSENIASLLGATGSNAHLKPLISNYIRGFSFELPFFCMGGVLSALVVIDSDFKRAGYARLAMSFFDIAGDLIVVLFFDGGMFLLGFTTAIAQLVYFFVMLTHFFQKNRMLRLKLPSPAEFARIFQDIISNGAPAGITSASGAVGGILVNRILSLSATSSIIAAFSVHKSVGSMFGVAYMCIADSVWTLSGIYYGEEDKKALGELQKLAVRKGLFYNCIIGLIIFVFARFFAMLFIGNADSEALSLATEAVRLLAVSMPLFVIVFSFKNYLMGIGRKKSANIYSVLSECVVQVLSVVAMVSILGGRGSWFATPLRLFTMILVAFFYIRMWKTCSSFHEKRLMLPEAFYSPDEKELSASVKSIDEVLALSKSAKKLCKENGIDDEKANQLVHCIEEAGNKIIVHGFSDSKPHSIDMRIIFKKEKLILRTRDDCRKLNPEIIREIAGDSHYINTVGTNNFIFQI